MTIPYLSNHSLFKSGAFRGMEFLLYRNVHAGVLLYIMAAR
jgi:hypothetical protein